MSSLSLVFSNFVWSQTCSLRESQKPDSHGRIPCEKNESVGLIHGGPRLHYLRLTPAYSSQIVLRTVSDSLALQEVISYDVPLQRVLIRLPLLLRRLHQLVLLDAR